MLEIEKTYLAKNIPNDLASHKKIEIIDRYFPANQDTPSLRLRNYNNQYELTKKIAAHPSDMSLQHEHTITLTPTEYESLKQIPAKMVHKIRYEYPYKGYIAEIGVFQGPLAGLVLIDVEFKTVEQKDAFTIPEFCLVDVTDQLFVSGKQLAGKSYTDIETELHTFGYTKIN